MKKRANLVFGGAGTLIPALVGAWSEIEKTVTPVRVAGTSAGSIVAAAIAFGIPTATMIEVGRKLLLRGALLDRRPLGMARAGWGLHAGNRLHAEITRLIPHRMEDASLPFGAWVTRVETGSPVFIDNDRFPDLLVADVVAASCSIPFFFSARRIRSLPGWFSDGGVTANFGTDAFDYSTEPTIGVRIAKQPETYALAKGPPDCDDPIEYVRLIMAAVMDGGSNTHRSAKKAYDVVDVVTKGSIVDFDMSLKEIDAMIADGASSARMDMHRISQKAWWTA